MPTVRGGSTRSGGQSRTAGYHNSAQIKKTMKEVYARDDLDKAFAGEENEGKFSREKHSTHLKNRKTKASKNKDHNS